MIRPPVYPVPEPGNYGTAKLAPKPSLLSIIVMSWNLTSFETKRPQAPMKVFLYAAKFEAS
jgi:hypothetical protein